MKCSWGGCQTPPVVSIRALAEQDEPFTWWDYGETLHACRNHMAVLCEPDPLTGNSYFLVQPI